MKMHDVIELVRLNSGRITVIEVAHHFSRLKCSNAYRSVRQMVSNAVALGHLRYGAECRRNLRPLARDYDGRPELEFVSFIVTIEEKRRADLERKWPGRMTLKQAAEHNGMTDKEAKSLFDMLRKFGLLQAVDWVNRATGIYALGDPKEDAPKPPPLADAVPRPAKPKRAGRVEQRRRELAAKWPHRMSVEEAAEFNKIKPIEATTLRQHMRACLLLRRCGYNEQGQVLYELGDPALDERGEKPPKPKPVKPPKPPKVKASPKPKPKPAKAKPRQRNPFSEYSAKSQGTLSKRAREAEQAYYANLFPRVASIFHLGDLMARSA